MKQLMKSMEVNPMRLLVGACSLGLILSLSQVGVAQQTAKTLAIPPQPVAAASSLNAFEPTSFSALMPGTATAHAASSPVVDEEEESPKPGKPRHEGVKVHGHWVMQVKNADGTLGERREFENSLVTTYATVDNEQITTSGSQMMVAMLSGNVAVSDPAIGFVQGNVSAGQDQSQYCSTALTLLNGISCYAFTSANSLYNQPLVGTYAGYSLGLAYTANFTPATSIVLSGNYTVPFGLTSIAAVQSLYGFCVPFNTTYAASRGIGFAFTLANSATFRNSDIPSVNCKGTPAQLQSLSELEVLFPLTSTFVTSGNPAVAIPLAVTPGQIIQVTVTLSFS